MTANRVNFVNKDDAGSILLALLEKITDAAGADADKHFHEVRTGNREKRHIGFAGNRPGQQSLAGYRRSDQQYNLWNTPAQLLEFLRVFEGDIFLLRGKQSRPRFAETQSLVSAGLHLAHQEQAEAHQQKQRQSVQQDDQPIAAANFLHIDAHLFVAQRLAQIRSVFLKDGGVEFLVGRLGVFALQLIAVRRKIHGYFLDVTLLDVGHELAVGGSIFAGRLAVLRDKLPEHHAQQHDRKPE